MNFLKPAVLAAAVSAAVSAGTASAAGFALIEQSASGLGNAYAGTAALAEDASTVWWNPAGMSKLPPGKQASLGAHAIVTSTRFGNGASVVPAAIQGTSGGDAGSLNGVPNAYFTMDYVPQWKLGLGVNVPFGLSTKYDPNWIGRFQGIESEVKTININPSASYAVNDSLSLGGGIDWQQGKVDLVSSTNYLGLAIAALGPGPGAAAVGAKTEGQNRVNLAGNAWGYNLGVLWDINSAARLGMSYRSSVTYDLGGSIRFSDKPAALAASPRLADGNVALQLKTPDMLSTSLAYKVTSKWQLLADVTWTGWAKIQAPPLVRDTGAQIDTLAFNFRNTIRTSIGANYVLNDGWTLKAGYAHDQTPVPNAETRRVSLPDNDRDWFALGAKYRVRQNTSLDFGYAHLQIKDAPINNDQQASGKGLVNGIYKSKVDILSAQLTYLF